MFKTIIFVVSISFFTGCSQDENKHLDDVSHKTKNGYRVVMDFDTGFERVAVETNIPEGLSKEDEIRYTLLKYLIVKKQMLDKESDLKMSTYFLSVGEKTDPSPVLMSSLKKLELSVLLKNESKSSRGDYFNDVIDPQTKEGSIIIYIDPFEIQKDDTGWVTLGAGWYMYGLGARHGEYKAKRTDKKITILKTGKGRIS